MKKTMERDLQQLSDQLKREGRINEIPHLLQKERWRQMDYLTEQIEKGKLSATDAAAINEALDGAAAALEDARNE